MMNRRPEVLAVITGAIAGDQLWRWSKRWWSRSSLRRELALAGWRDETIVNRALFTKADGLLIDGGRATLANATFAGEWSPVRGYGGHPIPGQWMPGPPAITARNGHLRVLGTITLPGIAVATGTTSVVGVTTE